MLQSLQLGRGLAASAVAAFHLSITMGDVRYGGDAVFRSWTSQGNLGVDFFFVLSGFIICFAHWADIDKPARVGPYLYKRIVRVYPIYLLYTLAFASLVLLGIGSGSKLPTSAEGWIGSVLLLPLTDESPPITPAWTLFHEVAFYMLFVTLLLNRRVGTVVLAVWAALIAWNFQHYDEQLAPVLRVYLSLYNLNFFIGMAAFALYRRAGQVSAAVLLGSGAMLLVATATSALAAGPEGTPLLYALSFGLVIAGAAALELRWPRLRLPYVSVVGDASYTIYLLHLALQGVALKVLLRVRADEWIGRAGVYVAVLALSIAAGCVIYLYVERPLLDALRRRQPAADSPESSHRTRTA